MFAALATINAQYLAPTLTGQNTNIYRSPFNLGQVSSHQKFEQTPFSSVSKSDVRVSNPGKAWTVDVKVFKCNVDCFIAPTQIGNWNNFRDQFLSAESVNDSGNHTCIEIIQTCSIWQYFLSWNVLEKNLCRMRDFIWISMAFDLKSNVHNILILKTSKI